jgi:protein TonB
MRFLFLVLAIGLHGWVLASLPSHEMPDLLETGGFRVNSMNLSVNLSRPEAAKTREASIEQNTVKKPASKPVAKKPTATARHMQPTRQRTERVTTGADDRPHKKQAETGVQEVAAIPAATSANPGVHKAIITEPRFITHPEPPTYPRLARKRGQEGTVYLDIWINQEGQQEKIAVFESSGVAMLDRAALAAVQKWHFMPYKINGRAVESHIRIPVEFILD